MKSRHLSATVCAGLLMLASAAANAIPMLQSRLGGQAYYDPVAHLTWLANANENGLMNWSAANAWADTLTVDGVSGWRLPTMAGTTCSGYNCTGSEMANLFYNVLGGTAYNSLTTTHNTNYSDFSNVQSYGYWSATEYAPAPGDAWVFYMDIGSQIPDVRPDGNYAWAVHTGDVGAATVPEPPTLALVGIGLLGLIGVGAKRRR